MTPTTIKAALEDLLLRRELPIEAAIDKHFAPGYRQRTDGEWSDRAEFAEHIAHLRDVVATLSIHVHEELSDGPLYAERHTVELTKTDGSPVVTEVYVFGERAEDGRFDRIEEVTMLLAGSEVDRGLGSARSS
jgi:hypothetical protein